MTDLQVVISDLSADGDEVDAMVADLDASQWKLPTPASGWTVAHQIAHLTAIFRMAALAAGDPEAFGAMAAKLSPDFDTNVRFALSQLLSDSPVDMFARWRSERAAAEKALAAAAPDQLVPWLVRPLPPAVLAAAGMMELFGHGQDIADALGLVRERTDRLRHLVGFIVRTWDFGYLARGLTPPDITLRFEITAPSGELWQFGPADSTERISGPAVDLCLVATRRRHRDDLALTASGAEADHWLTIAQAYRGPAGPGRSPGQFARER